MHKAGQFFAMLIRRWGSKTPKRSGITQVVIGVLGTAAWIALAIPALGVTPWITIPAGIIAYTASAYKQLNTEDKETISQEVKHILNN